MKSILLIFISSAVLKTCAQPDAGVVYSRETGRIVRKIEKVHVLMSSAVGYAGTRPAQFDNFTELKKTAGQHELVALTDHRNPVVRCYAFWALSLDSTAHLFPIVLKHTTDYEIVNTQFGCTGGAQKAGDFFIDVVTPQYVDLSAKKLDSAQLLRLDSILIYGNSHLEARSIAISRAAQSDKLYDVVRALVLEKKDPYAIVALAKYHRKQDIPLVLDSKHNDSYHFTFQAIEEFPDTGFLPFLEKNMTETFDDAYYSNEWVPMYSAIAAYQNKKALDLLKRPFTETTVPNIRDYHISYIFSALQKYRIPLYDSLLWHLWENEGKISINVYKYLSGKDPLKAFLLSKKTLGSFDGLFHANNSFDPENEDNTENLAEIMLDLVLQEDREFGLEIIRTNIKGMSVHVFPLFAKKISELKDGSFIEPLFWRLETEDNPHVYLAVTEALINYNDPNINKRIVAARKKNKALTEGWGSESLDELLRQHHIE